MPLRRCRSRAWETSVLQTPVSDWNNEEVYQNLESLTLKQWKVWLPKLMAGPQVTRGQLLRATKCPGMTMEKVQVLEEKIMRFLRERVGRIQGPNCVDHKRPGG